MRRTEHAVSMRNMRNPYNILIRKTERETLLRRLKCRENNIKMDVK
jgi:hypothetical protein